MNKSQCITFSIEGKSLHLTATLQYLFVFLSLISFQQLFATDELATKIVVDRYEGYLTSIDPIVYEYTNAADEEDQGKIFYSKGKYHIYAKKTGFEEVCVEGCSQTFFPGKQENPDVLLCNTISDDAIVQNINLLHPVLLGFIRYDVNQPLCYIPDIMRHLNLNINAETPQDVYLEGERNGIHWNFCLDKEKNYALKKIEFHSVDQQKVAGRILQYHIELSRFVEPDTERPFFFPSQAIAFLHGLRLVNLLVKIK